jgi:hypothetical protein
MKRQSIAVALCLLFCGVANAQLLTPANESQIEVWLGQGDVTFRSLFSATFGDLQTPADFHRAVDLQGPTITLFAVSTNPAASTTLPAQVVGGYNPVSWDTTTGFRNTPSPAERTAFIFNLTQPELQRQDPIGFFGQWQTNNAAGLGPVFGVGVDLGPSAGTLSFGSAQAFSYGPGGNAITFGETGPLAGDDLGYDQFRIDRLEVYALSPMAVPEPSVIGAIAASVLLLTIAGRRIRRGKKVETS